MNVAIFVFIDILKSFLKNSIKFQVLLPVPDYVYTMLPLDQMKTMTFSITPVLFNVGINEKATLAHKMGLNGPQEKNNIDNFKALAEYYRRYKKLNLNTSTSKNGKSKHHNHFCIFEEFRPGGWKLSKTRGAPTILSQKIYLINSKV